MPVHYERYRGSKIAVVIETDASGLYFAPSVLVTATRGGVPHEVPHEVVAFRDKAQALKDAITRAEVYINDHVEG